ncbi:MAG: M42 family metallopeptidase [Chloroflexi bacterium]|nr:M42 family metallopeptidase [Chloroflexota bacterium]
MKALIEKLTNVFSPSGFEDAIRDVIRKEIKGFADEIRVDALGNLIAHKNPSAGAKGAKRVMVAAHMDEIGLMVTHVDENGFVRFSNVGGVFGRYAPSGRVRFTNGAAGVINNELLSNFRETPPLDKMFIDVGATSQKDCPVKLGDVAAFERPFLDLGKRVVAKSLDDRLGVAVLIETMRRLKSRSERVEGAAPNEVYFVFTAQEEVGTRGAGPAAYGIDPDVAIAVDVTPTGDTPMGRKMEVALGGGPAIKIKDQGMLADPRVVSWMAKTAERSKIPYQREVLIMGSTDARAIQVTRAGIAAGGISIPARYVHSPSEMVDMDDVENSVRLLAALLNSKVSL